MLIAGALPVAIDAVETVFIANSAMRAEFEAAELDGHPVVARLDRGERQTRGAERIDRRRRIGDADRVNPNRRWCVSAVALGHEARQSAVSAEPDAAVARGRRDVDLVAGEAVGGGVVPDDPRGWIDAVHAQLGADVDAAAVVVGERAGVVAGEPLRRRPRIEARTVGVFASDETKASHVGRHPQVVPAIPEHRANFPRRCAGALGPELEAFAVAPGQTATIGEPDPQRAVAVFRERRRMSRRRQSVASVEDVQASGGIPFREAAPGLRPRRDPDVTAPILVQPLDDATGQRAAATEVLDDRRRLAVCVAQVKGAGRCAQPPVARARLQHHLLPDLAAVARRRAHWRRQTDRRENPAIEAAEGAVVRCHHQPTGAIADNGRDAWTGSRRRGQSRGRAREPKRPAL